MCERFSNIINFWIFLEFQTEFTILITVKNEMYKMKTQNRFKNWASLIWKFVFFKKYSRCTSVLMKCYVNVGENVICRQLKWLYWFSWLLKCKIILCIRIQHDELFCRTLNYMSQGRFFHIRTASQLQWYFFQISRYLIWCNVQWNIVTLLTICSR